MSSETNTPLAEMMKTVINRSKAASGAAIEGLAVVADDLDLGETAVKLRETASNLQSDTFNIIVIGRFKNGKSTLLNALIGGTTEPVDLAGHEGPMVVDDLPATATLTWVRYADEPYVKAWGFDGKAEQWTLGRYLSDSILDIDEEESQRRFQNIREFEMGFPARLCQAGVTLYDSPGLDEHVLRTNITREASKRCDAAIVVYRSDVLMGQNEMMDAGSLIAEGTRVFTVVNLWSGRKPDDRLKGYVWNRYVRDHQGGPTWAGQDLSTRDLYLLDANAGREARYEGDDGGVEASGLAVFERRLADFLLRDRYQSHLRKFSVQAETLASAIDQHIAQRRMAVRTDQNRLREAYDGILPKLTEIRRRPTRLAALVHRHRDAAVAALTTNFMMMIADLRDELPAHIAQAELQSFSRYTAVLQQKKISAEVSGIISDFVSQRLTEWESDQAKETLRPILQQFATDISAEIADLGDRFQEIQFELVQWELESRSGSIVGTTERILSAVAHVFLLDIAGVAVGSVGGWRSAVGSAAGAFGAGLVLVALGPFAPGLLGAIVLASMLSAGGGILAGGIGLQERAKAKALEQTDVMLREMPEQMAPQIEHSLTQAFEQLEKAVAEEVTALIEEEERNIKKIVSLNQLDQAERDKVMDVLDEASADVAKYRQALVKIV